MSWPMMKVSAVLLWIMSGLSVITGVLSGLWGLDLVLPALLAAATALAGLMYWRMGSEQQRVMSIVQESLEEMEMPQELVKGLIRGELDEEQFQKLCEWTDEQQKGSQA